MYYGAGRKTFLNDNQLKYGDHVTTTQIRQFRTWVLGYPAAAMDRERDIDESIVLLNPFVRPVVVTISLAETEIAQRIKIAPLCGRRVALSALLPLEHNIWAGQIFVTGRSRLVVFFAKHAVAGPDRHNYVGAP